MQPSTAFCRTAKLSWLHIVCLKESQQQWRTTPDSCLCTAETSKTAAIFNSRNYFTKKRYLEAILLGRHARGMNMRSWTFGAIIGENLLEMARSKQAQHSFLAAHSNQHVQKSLRVLQRAIGSGQRKDPLGMHLCMLCCYLEDEHAAHDVALDILKERKQRQGLTRTQAPFNALNQSSAPFPSTFLHS